MGEKVRILRLLEAFLAPGFPETSTDLEDKMGYYLNPCDMSKEDFLQKYGKDITKQDFLNPNYDPTMMKVCLVDNGLFKAAAIGYSQQECEEFCRPGDMRAKRFFAVHPSDAKAHDCESEAFFKIYWPEA